MKMRVGLVLLFLIFNISGCATSDSIDLSEVNSSIMDLRGRTGLEATSLLRNLSTSGGGVGCTVCAH